ncbi:MAG: MATE family efflux transporter [Prevotella sp.]|nr:MATE family efflux transporter [Prevotella sp.]
MIDKLGNILNGGSQRTRLVKKNILVSMLIKGWGSIVQFLLVPVTLGCLNQYEYGIWLTINSILVWIDSFDIGLGNGLRNNLAESLAKGDKNRGQQQVSTTFFMLIGLVIPVLGIVFILIASLNTYNLLNVSPQIVPNLDGILMVSFAFVGATFVFKFIGNIYLAMQLPAINNLLVVSGQTLSFFGILLFSKIGHPSLFDIALIYTLSPLLVYVISYPITFTKYYFIRPSLNAFSCKELHSLFSLGVNFFFIQIGALILFATSNLIISDIYSPKEVTTYQIAFRYFGIANIIFTIISAPLWTATTDAYTKEDWTWINNITIKMKKILIIFATCIILMLLISKPIYYLWIRNKVEIPFSMSCVMAIYIFIAIFSTYYSNMICGFGKIHLLTIITLTQAIIYIPLAIWFSYQAGVIGVVIALLLVNLLSAVTNKIQFEKIKRGKATGIWNK